MSKRKNVTTMTQIAVKSMEGKGVCQIGEEVGVSRQTVWKYLNSPELQSVMDGAQKSALTLFSAAITRATNLLASGDPSDKKDQMALLKTVIASMAGRVITSGPQGSITEKVQEVTPEEKRKKIDDMKRILLMGGKYASEGKVITVEEAKDQEVSEESKEG